MSAVVIIEKGLKELEYISTDKDASTATKKNKATPA